MPWSMVERSFREGSHVPVSEEGAARSRGVDKRTTYRVYDVADPRASRQAANRGELPVHRSVEWRVSDPYFYR